MSFFAELKRRKVYKVAALDYLQTRDDRDNDRIGYLGYVQ